MSAGWLFVAASLIAVIGIVIVFKQLIHQIGNLLDKGEGLDEAVFQQQMTRFFVKVAIIEVLPIILIVFGFMQLNENKVASSVMIPLTIIILTFLFGIINVILSKSGLQLGNEIDSKVKSYITTIMFIGIAFVSTIPLMCVIGLLVL